MTAIARIALLVLALALGGWLAYHHLARGSVNRPLAWQDLTAELPVLELPRQASHTFRSRAYLASYLAHAMPEQHVIPPPIDFAHREAFIVTVGPRSSTGYTLRIIGVRDRGSHVTVLVREETPTLTTRVVPRLTYPSKLITIPKTSKPVYAKFEGRP